MTLLYAPPEDEIITVLRGLDPYLAEFPGGTVYLLHLPVPYVAVTGKRQKSFSHYTGRADPGRLPQRLSQHGTTEGARCLYVARQAGLTWYLARTWPGGHEREMQLKAQGSARRYCPMCGVVPRNTQPGRQK